MKEYKHKPDTNAALFLTIDMIWTTAFVYTRGGEKVGMTAANAATC